MSSGAGKLLLETARRGELHHAIILHGPSPSDLRALSMQIAKALNCLNGTTGDDCAACQKIDRGVHPDLHIVEVAAERKMISIEQIRDTVAAATMRPFEGRTKVFIIDPADAISANGLNALLKTLEEPARDTVFLLLTRSPDQLLPTVRSRCQSIHIALAEKKAEGGGDRRLAQIATADRDARADLAREFRTLFGRFAEAGDALSLLALAAAAAAWDPVPDAMAVLAIVLTSPEADASSVPREQRLAAADALMWGIDAVRKVNADARLVIESALARMAAG